MLYVDLVQLNFTNWCNFDQENEEQEETGRQGSLDSLAVVMDAFSVMKWYCP